MLRDQVEQRDLARLVERVAGLRLERGRAVREHRPQARPNRPFIELSRIEQRDARTFDRIAHPQRRRLAAQPRGEIRLAIAGEERMRVRVDEARRDDESRRSISPIFVLRLCASVTGAGPTAVILPSSMIIAASSTRPSLLKSMPAWSASVSQVTTVLARTIHEFGSATSASIRRDGTCALHD